MMLYCTIVDGFVCTAHFLYVNVMHVIHNSFLIGRLFIFGRINKCNSNFLIQSLLT